jgi:hypothetical protein
LVDRDDTFIGRHEVQPVTVLFYTMNRRKSR